MHQQVFARLLRQPLLSRDLLLRHRCVCFPATIGARSDLGSLIKTSPSRNYSFKNPVDNWANVRSAQRNVVDESRGKKINRGWRNDRKTSVSNNYFLDLERRTVHHISLYSSCNTDKKELIKWHSTTLQLIMELTKLWGKDRAFNQVSPAQVTRGVLLADELMGKVLDMIKNELQTAMKTFQGVQQGEKYEEEEKYNSSSAHKYYTPRNKGLLDTELCFQMVVLGWSRCDPQTVPQLNTARKAQMVLEHLENVCRMYDSLPHSYTQKLILSKREIQPTTMLYNHVISCWSRSSDPNAEDCAQDLLNRMATGNAFSPPDVISYNNMLHMYANQGRVEKAQSLLSQMEDPKSQSSLSLGLEFPKNIEMKPDVFSYSIVINALRKRFVAKHDMNDPIRAEKILTDMVKKGVMPNGVCYATVLSIYAIADKILRDGNASARKWKNRELNNKEGWGAENAKRVLGWMIKLSERGYMQQDGMVSDVTMTSHHFATVIDAIAKSGNGIEGAKECEQLCDRLISLYEKSGADYLRPRPEVFGAVIDAWSKADQEYSSAEQAEAVLNRMENFFMKEQKDRNYMLSNVAYNLVIDAWSRRSGSDTAERAERVLHRMIQKYLLTKNNLLRPDVISFTSVIKAYVGRPDGGKKALDILKEMDKQYKDGNMRAKADPKTISIAMDACVKSGCLDEASRLLDHVDNVDKTRVMFNTIISAFKNEGRGLEAEGLLRKMIEWKDIGYKNCSPDSTTYSLCIAAWGATSNATSQKRLERARALFDECIQGYVDGDKLLQLNSSHFNTIADVIALSDVPNKELLILSLFQVMEKMDCSPCLVSFNILIKACGSIKGTDARRAKALHVAVSAFKSIEAAGLKADSVTYTSMIRTVIWQTKNQSDKVNALSEIFQKCCTDGCLNENILRLLTGAMSENEFSIISGGLAGDTRFESLPAKWSSSSSKTI